MVDNTVTGEVCEEMEASLLLSTDIERLKKQKRVVKTQTSKLYTKLLRLMSNEKCESEELLQGLDAYEEKQQATLTIIDELILAYKKAGDKQNAVKTEDELEIVTKDTNRDAVTVKSFILAMVTKPMKRSPDVLDTAQSKGYSDGVDQAHTSKVEVNSWRELRHLRDDCERRAGEEKPVKTEGVDRSLERLQIPKFDGDKSKFASFWAAFSAIVDKTSPLSKHKMLRLKACLEGKAAEAIAK